MTDILPSSRIDPDHPLQYCFEGTVDEASKWTRQAPEMRRRYRESLGYNPGSVVYFYLFTRGEDGELAYYGVTRNPHVRFKRHRRTPWWASVTHVAIDCLDCSRHAGVCTAAKLFAAALRLESFFIDALEPTENITVGRFE